MLLHSPTSCNEVYSWRATFLFTHTHRFRHGWDSA
nr:MAG TPA: hypothetical protein [Caudoviricetes sp.]